MLIDLLSQSNYGSYNIEVAHVFGLKASVYLSEVIAIQQKAIRKNKVENNYFVLDRSYLQSRTTLSSEEQIEIENALLSLNILRKSSESNQIYIDLQYLVSVLASDNPEVIDNVKKLAQIKSKPAKATKKQALIEQMQSFIETTNFELRNAYFDWVEAVYANPNGFLSKQSVKIFQQTVDEFADHNLDTALSIVKIATVNGYRDATWAINSFNSNFKPNYKIQPQVEVRKEPVEIGKEVF